MYEPFSFDMALSNMGGGTLKEVTTKRKPTSPGGGGIMIFACILHQRTAQDTCPTFDHAYQPPYTKQDMMIIVLVASIIHSHTISSPQTFTNHPTLAIVSTNPHQHLIGPTEIETTKTPRNWRRKKMRRISSTFVVVHLDSIQPFRPFWNHTKPPQNGGGGVELETGEGQTSAEGKSKAPSFHKRRWLCVWGGGCRGDHRSRKG